MHKIHELAQACKGVCSSPHAVPQQSWTCIHRSLSAQQSTGFLEGIPGWLRAGFLCQSIIPYSCGLVQQDLETGRWVWRVSLVAGPRTAATARPL